MSESKVCFRWKHGQKITANDLVLALNEAYGLGMAGSNIWILWFWMVTNEWQFYRFIGLYGRRN